MRVEDLPEIDLESAAFKAGVAEADAALAAARTDPGMGRSQRGVEVLSYELALDVLRDRRFNVGVHQMITGLGITEGPIYDMHVGSIINSEGDTHRRMRRACASWFVPARAESLRAEISSWTDAWIDERLDDGRIDFLHDIGRRLPATLFCRVVGEPLDHAEMYAQISEEALNLNQVPTPEGRANVEKGTVAAAEHTRRIIADRRSAPGEDLVSTMLESEARGEITDDDIVHTVFTVLVGSTDTTNAQICLNLQALAENPEQWQRLKEQPELVANAVMELVRFNSGVWTITRSPIEPTEFLGMQMTRDDVIWPLVFAANRDPKMFDEPTKLDISREFRRNPLNFGSGVHACLGRVFALLEQEEVLRSMLRHWDDLGVNEFEVHGQMNVTGVDRMTVDFTRKSSRRAAPTGG